MIKIDQNIHTVIFNGVDVTAVKFNGVVVWNKFNNVQVFPMEVSHLSFTGGVNYIGFKTEFDYKENQIPLKDEEMLGDIITNYSIKEHYLLNSSGSNVTITEQATTEAITGNFIGSTSVQIGDKGFIFGGTTTGFTTTVYEYFLNTNILLKSSLLLPAAKSYAKAFNIGKKIYIIGGNTTATYIIDLDLNNNISSITTGNPIPAVKNHPKIIFEGDYIYVVGGSTVATYRALVTNDTIGAWETVASLAMPIAKPGGYLFRSQNKYFICFHYNNIKTTYSSTVVDGVLSSWVLEANQTEAVQGYGVEFQSGNKGYVIGTYGTTQIWEVNISDAGCSFSLAPFTLPLSSLYYYPIFIDNSNIYAFGLNAVYKYKVNSGYKPFEIELKTKRSFPIATGTINNDMVAVFDYSFKNETISPIIELEEKLVTPFVLRNKEVIVKTDTGLTKILPTFTSFGDPKDAYNQRIRTDINCQYNSESFIVEDVQTITIGGTTIYGPYPSFRTSSRVYVLATGTTNNIYYRSISGNINFQRDSLSISGHIRSGSCIVIKNKVYAFVGEDNATRSVYYVGIINDEGIVTEWQTKNLPSAMPKAMVFTRDDEIVLISSTKSFVAKIEDELMFREESYPVPTGFSDRDIVYFQTKDFFYIIGGFQYVKTVWKSNKYVINWVSAGANMLYGGGIFGGVILIGNQIIKIHNYSGSNIETATIDSSGNIGTWSQITTTGSAMGASRMQPFVAPDENGDNCIFFQYGISKIQKIKLTCLENWWSGDWNTQIGFYQTFNNKPTGYISHYSKNADILFEVDGVTQTPTLVEQNLDDDILTSRYASSGTGSNFKLRLAMDAPNRLLKIKLKGE